jgi:hypothetical protein
VVEALGEERVEVRRDLGLADDRRNPLVEQLVARVAETLAGELVDGDVAHVLVRDEDEGGPFVDRLAEQGGLDECFCDAQGSPIVRSFL